MPLRKARRLDIQSSFIYAKKVANHGLFSRFLKSKKIFAKWKKREGIIKSAVS